MENEKAVIVVLKFHTDTFELDIDAPDLKLDFVIALIDWAKRLLEEQGKILTARVVSQVVRPSAAVAHIKLP